MREYLVESAMYFLNEVHIDGLRVDGTAWIRRTGADLGGGDVQDNPDGWSWLQYLNNSVDGKSPEKIIVAEDGYNDWAVRGQPLRVEQDLTASGTPISIGPFAAPSKQPTTTIRACGPFGTPSTLRTTAIPSNRSCTPRTMTKWPTAVQGFKNHLAGQRGRLLLTKEKLLHAWRGLGHDGSGVPMIFQGQEFLEDEYFRDSDALD